MKKWENEKWEKRTIPPSYTMLRMEIYEMTFFTADKAMKVETILAVE